MTTREILCEPIAGAAVDGFSFFRDQNGAVTARCVYCLVGFPVTAETAAESRHAMRTHLDVVHGVGDRLRPDW